MSDQGMESTGSSTLLIATVLVAAIGGALFWAWRQSAPLSRWVYHYRCVEGGQSEPSPQQKPGTKPL